MKLPPVPHLKSTRKRSSLSLYQRLLSYILRYWTTLLLSVLLTVLFVGFNNLSLWISVDFIRELFSPEVVQQSGSQAQDANDLISELDQIRKKDTEGSGIYSTINRAIKNLIIRPDKYDTLKVVCIVLFLSFLLKNIVHYLRRVLLTFMEIKIVVALRNDLHHRIIRLPISYFDKRHSGELTSVAFNDVNQIKQVLHENFSQMILAPIQIIVNVIIMFLISWQLSLASFIIIPVSSFLIIFIGKIMRRRSRKALEQVANVLATFQEAVSAIKIVKAFSNENKETTKFEQANHLYFLKRFKANKIKYATTPINEVLLVIVVVALLWYGGGMVYQGSSLSAEAFIRFLIFLFTLFQPIKELSGFNNIIQSGMAAAERIFTILDTPAEPQAEAKPDYSPAMTSHLRLENINFKYNDQDTQPVLDNINIEIHPGEFVAFVGPSGAGKSTLLNLLPRFYEPSSGRILIDDRDITTFGLPELRSLFGIVTQDTILFSESLRYNISYGREAADDSEIRQAASAANALDFIVEMKDGLETQVGEHGTRLSGGQKQRISIARALIKNPPILIFDEATSSLDSESERLVQQAIERMHGRRTILVIAHRLSTIQNADKIVVMKSGRIEAVGKHRELLRRSALYKSLYSGILSETESNPESD